MNQQDGATRDIEPLKRKDVVFLIVLLMMSLGISLPAILSGYIIDDNVFASAYYQPGSWFDYYGYIHRLRELDYLPWWSSPELKLNFFRPLSSLTLHLDYRVWGSSPLVGHIHSVLWFVGMFFGAFKLLGSLPISRRQVGWALAVFALAGCHTWTIGFIAARHAVMAGTFCIWSIYFYRRWRVSGRAVHGGISLGLILLGLLSSEAALAAPVFVVVGEWLSGRGDGKGKLRLTAPMVGGLAVYFALYKGFGYGTSGSAAYLDPLADPGAYLLGLPTKFFAVFGSFFWGVPAQLRVAQGIQQVPVAAGGVGLVIFVLTLLLSWRRFSKEQQQLVKWLGLAGLAAMLPGLAGFAVGTTMTLFGISFAVVTTSMLSVLFGRRQRWYRRILPIAAGVVIGLGVFLLSPLIRLGQSHLMLNRGSAAMSSLARGEKLPCKPSDRIYLLNGDLMMSYYAPFVVAKNQGVLFPHWQQLVETTTDIQVERNGEDSFVIHGGKQGLLNPMMLQLFRSADAPLTGETRISHNDLTVHVLDKSKDGTESISFTIPGLDRGEKICLLTVEDFKLREFELPTVGTSKQVPYVQPKL